MANLKRRLERLEGGQRGKGMTIIVTAHGETSEEAVQRHLVKHPEDEKSDKLVIGGTGQEAPNAPPPPRPEAKEPAKAPGPAPRTIID